MAPSIAYTAGDDGRPMRIFSSGGDNSEEGCSQGWDTEVGWDVGIGPVGHTGICRFGIGLDRRFTVKAEGIGEAGGVEWCSACC